MSGIPIWDSLGFVFCEDGRFYTNTGVSRVLLVFSHKGDLYQAPIIASQNKGYLTNRTSVYCCRKSDHYVILEWEKSREDLIGPLIEELHFTSESERLSSEFISQAMKRLVNILEKPDTTFSIDTARGGGVTSNMKVAPWLVFTIYDIQEIAKVIRCRFYDKVSWNGARIPLYGVCSPIKQRSLYFSSKLPSAHLMKIANRLPTDTTANDSDNNDIVNLYTKEFQIAHHSIKFSTKVWIWGVKRTEAGQEKGTFLVYTYSTDTPTAVSVYDSITHEHTVGWIKGTVALVHEPYISD